MNDKSRIYQVLSVVVTVLMIYFVWDRILPMYTESFGTIFDYITIDQDSETQYTIVIIELKQRIRRLHKEVGLINAELPTEREFSKATSMLDSLEEKTGLDIAGMKTLASDSTSEYKLIKTELNTVSRYSDLKKFVTDIEGNSRPITISRLFINIPDLKNRSVTTTLGLEIICQKN